jgi:hypothetical protein
MRCELRTQKISSRIRPKIESLFAHLLPVNVTDMHDARKKFQIQQPRDGVPVITLSPIQQLAVSPDVQMRKILRPPPSLRQYESVASDAQV